MSEWLFVSVSHPPRVLFALASKKVVCLKYRAKDCALVENYMSIARIVCRLHSLASTAFFAKVIGVESNKLSHTLALQIWVCNTL